MYNKTSDFDKRELDLIYSGSKIQQDGENSKVVK